MNFKQGTGNLAGTAWHCLSQGLQFLAGRSSQILWPVEDTRPWGAGAGRHCTSQMAPTLSALSPCYCATTQIFLCDLSDIPFSHAGIPDACIPMLALGKCINKYRGKREKRSCSFGDFYPREKRQRLQWLTWHHIVLLYKLGIIYQDCISV